MPTAEIGKSHDTVARTRGGQLATKGQLRLFGKAPGHLIIVQVWCTPASSRPLQGALEGVDHVRVELRTRVLAQLRQRVTLGESHAI
jgi:hypothetical protein